MQKFILSIDLGNDAMLTETDIAEALHRTANRVECGGDSAPILDLNGNTVGRWEFVGDNDD